MSTTLKKAEQVISILKNENKAVEQAKSICQNDDEWFRVSSKAYQLFLSQAKKQRKIDQSKRHVLVTSLEEIEDLFTVNEKLTDYALFVPTIATSANLNHFNTLSSTLPSSENDILLLIGKMTMSPNFRTRQKKGRFEHFQVFKEFTKIIDAATISFFRENYISSYLTLVPVIEGILLRWLGFNGVGKKPEFIKIKKFFRNSSLRQPCPGNILFHKLYTKVCDKILNQHLFLPSQAGNAHSNFNRHFASHLLSNSQFATKENCIRLFMLIDIMTEIYLLENYLIDPRFSLENEEIQPEIEIYVDILVSQHFIKSAEQEILGTL